MCGTVAPQKMFPIISVPPFYTIIAMKIFIYCENTFKKISILAFSYYISN